MLRELKGDNKKNKEKEIGKGDDVASKRNALGKFKIFLFFK